MPKSKSKNNNKEDESNSGSNVGYAIQIILSIFAAYLNWNCLSNSSLVVKLLTTVASFFFATYYLMFYLVFKVIMGQTCQLVTHQSYHHATMPALIPGWGLQSTSLKLSVDNVLKQSGVIEVTGSIDNLGNPLVARPNCRMAGSRWLEYRW